MNNSAGVDSRIQDIHLLLSNLTPFFLLGGLLLFLFVIGVAANVAVCITLTQGNRLKKHLSNFMLFHLSITDMVYRLIVVPGYFIAAISPAEKNHLLCKVTKTLLSSVHSAIFTSLVVIALDRHYSITKPFQRLKHKPNFFICIVAVWGYSIVCASPHMFTEEVIFTIGSNYTYHNLRGVNVTLLYSLCSPAIKGSVSQKIMTTAYFILGFLLPLAILTVAYCSIAVFLKRKSRNGSTSQAVLRSKGKALRMLVLMVIGFVVCLGAPESNDLLQTFSVQSTAFSSLAYVLQLSSSLVNVLIYGFYSAEFRRGVSCLGK